MCESMPPSDLGWKAEWQIETRQNLDVVVLIPTEA